MSGQWVSQLAKEHPKFTRGLGTAGLGLGLGGITGAATAGGIGFIGIFFVSLFFICIICFLSSSLLLPYLQPDNFCWCKKPGYIPTTDCDKHGYILEPAKEPFRNIRKKKEEFSTVNYRPKMYKPYY